MRSAGTSRHADAAGQIAASLLSTTEPSRKRCAFIPGYAIRYWRGTKSVSILFCFNCDEARIIPSAASGEPALGMDIRDPKAALKFLQGEFSE